MFISFWYVNRNANVQGVFGCHVAYNALGQLYSGKTK